MLSKLVGSVTGALLVLLIVGAGPLVWLYDRAPPGWPDLHVRVLFVHLTWRLPDSLAAQRDGYRKAYAAEHGAFLTEEAAVEQQNAAIARMSAASAAWQARSRQATSDAAEANAWRLATAARIARMTLPAGLDAAAQCKAAETLLRGAAR